MGPEQSWSIARSSMPPPMYSTICATCSPRRRRRAPATVSPALRPTAPKQMIAARMALADVPLKQFLNEAVIPYEDDEVTRLILDSHEAPAFAPISVADRRRLPRLAVVRCRNQRNAGEGLARDHAGNGRRRLQADAQPGSDPGRQEVRGDDGVSQHHRPEGADERAAAAQPSLRRRQGHYRLDPRRHPAWDRAMPASASIRPATIRP